MLFKPQIGKKRKYALGYAYQVWFRSDTESGQKDGSCLKNALVRQKVPHSAISPFSACSFQPRTGQEGEGGAAVWSGLRPALVLHPSLYCRRLSTAPDLVSHSVRPGRTITNTARPAPENSRLLPAGPVPQPTARVQAAVYSIPDKLVRLQAR